MPTPRSHLIEPNSPGCYHLYSRCVRQAWLCGLDALTGRSRDHRRDWIEKRLHFLCARFAVELHGYAVMSNHYHLVIHVDPQAPQRWSDDLIARRWIELFPSADTTDAERDRRIAAIVADAGRLAELRRRLGSLSWLMRLLNEHVARRANREDACKGRFWEGRFESRVLLDEAAWLAAMAYVDLNPVRAGITREAESAANTSISHRVRTDGHPPSMVPVASGMDVAGPMPALSFADYRILLRDTAAATEDGDTDTARNHAIARLRPPGVPATEWLARVGVMSRHDRRALGAIDALRAYARRLGQRWVRGVHDLAVRRGCNAGGAS